MDLGKKKKKKKERKKKIGNRGDEKNVHPGGCKFIFLSIFW